MKRHRKRDSLLPSRSQCLGNICGSNIDLEGIEFSNQRGNLVYLDKVFSFNEDTSCPLLFNLNTGGANANNFTVKFTLENKGCSIVPCTLSPNAVFTINNSFVVVEYFNTRPPGNINAGQVTLDGFPVDSVSYSNGQYTAKTANVLARVQKDRCLDEGLPTKVFFLINNAGPWDFRATYVLEGTVNTNGRICCFRVEISNAMNASNTSLPSGSLSNFAVPDLSLPCSINGIAPDITFQFNAKIHMVNPRLIVNCGTPTAGMPMAANGLHECCPPCSEVGSIGSCTVSLVTSLAIEPVVHVQTVRRTLFCLNACEALQPCQGSIAAAEEEAEEECLEDVFEDVCRCGRGEEVEEESDRDRDRCRDRDRVRGERDRECNTNFQPPCGNRLVGGITVGVGTCDDCNDGRNRNDEDVAGTSDRKGGRRKKHRREEVLGTRFCREELIEEIVEAILDSCGCDDEGIAGLGTDGTFGCDCDEVSGTEDRDRNKRKKRDRDEVGGTEDRDNRKTRTAFQFNGCNGCSW